MANSRRGESEVNCGTCLWRGKNDGDFSAVPTSSHLVHLLTVTRAVSNQGTGNVFPSAAFRFH